MDSGNWRRSAALPHMGDPARACEKCAKAVEADPQCAPA